MVAHKHYSSGQVNYLNIEKKDWKMDGEINSRQGQERAMRLKSVSLISFWKTLVLSRTRYFAEVGTVRAGVTALVSIVPSTIF